MAEQLEVRARPGVAFPRAAPLSGFVGYELATGEPEPDDHVVAGGPRYRRKAEAERVPNNVYYRRALGRGDIQEAESEHDIMSEAGDEAGDEVASSLDDETPPDPGDQELTDPAFDPSAPDESAG